MCVNRLFHVKNRTNSLAIEYLAVEFARDVEYPTPMTTTTQETVALHLSQNPYPNICVASVGQHDAAIPNMTTDLYLRNVREYLTLLDTSCSRIIWLGLNSVKGAPDFPQTNAQLYEFNQGVYALPKKEFTKTSSIVNVWNASLRMLHFNNVHMGDEYTWGLAELFQRLIEWTL